jgi:hypothetical protein
MLTQPKEQFVNFKFFMTAKNFNMQEDCYWIVVPMHYR